MVSADSNPPCASYTSLFASDLLPVVLDLLPRDDGREKGREGGVQVFAGIFVGKGEFIMKGRKRA